MQDISAVVSTEEFQNRLEGVAKKCSADYRVLPAVSSVDDDPKLENVPLDDILAEVDKTSSALEGTSLLLCLLYQFKDNVLDGKASTTC